MVANIAEEISQIHGDFGFTFSTQIRGTLCPSIHHFQADSHHNFEALEKCKSDGNNGHEQSTNCACIHNSDGIPAEAAKTKSAAEAAKVGDDEEDGHRCC